jgi:hypothetical protein
LDIEVKNKIKIKKSPVLKYIKSTKKYRVNIPSDFFGFMSRPNGHGENNKVHKVLPN